MHNPIEKKEKKRSHFTTRAIKEKMPKVLKRKEDKSTKKLKKLLSKTDDPMTAAQKFGILLVSSAVVIIGLLSLIYLLQSPRTTKRTKEGLIVPLEEVTNRIYFDLSVNGQKVSLLLYT